MFKNLSSFLIIAAIFQELNEMFASCNMYGRKNNVAAKAEKATADMTKKTLLDIFVDGSTSQLSNYKIYFLYNGNTLKSIVREVLVFVGEVENLVSNCILLVAFITFLSTVLTVT